MKDNEAGTRRTASACLVNFDSIRDLRGGRVRCGFDACTFTLAPALGVDASEPDNPVRLMGGEGASLVKGIWSRKEAFRADQVTPGEMSNSFKRCGDPKTGPEMLIGSFDETFCGGREVWKERHTGVVTVEDTEIVDESMTNLGAGQIRAKSALEEVVVSHRSARVR